MKPSDVLEWNYFKFMQIDHPRWPLEAVTKNSINMKMTISRVPFVEINPSVCQNVSCIKPFGFFLQFGITRWPPFAVIKSNPNVKMAISQ